MSVPFFTLIVYHYHLLKYHKLILGKKVRLRGFLHILRFWPDFWNEEELETTFLDCLGFDFLGIKKNFLISKSVDDIPPTPEVENDESTSL